VQRAHTGHRRRRAERRQGRRAGRPAGSPASKSADPARSNCCPRSSRFSTPLVTAKDVRKATRLERRKGSQLFCTPKTERSWCTVVATFTYIIFQLFANSAASIGLGASMPMLRIHSLPQVKGSASKASLWRSPIACFNARSFAVPFGVCGPGKMIPSYACRIGT
jgi:hypothetical protein